MVGGQLVVVDAINDGQVDALGGRRNQHALGAGGEVLARTFGIGEKARAFERDVDAQLGVRQVGGVAFLGDADRLAVDDHLVALGRNVARERSVDAVALEQQGIGFRVRQIVDRDQFEPAVGAFEDGACHEAADASETVDCNLHCHVETSFLRGISRSLVAELCQDLGCDSIGGKAEMLE